ncbi:Major Facilitator Superfamily protein [Amycolatopsis tolypomycina]|uniref:Major Facilitator Superfamily protein n=1 Tax=Amycolatopsis tolypomycina TaxID=208445 RepID=A0A1H4YVD9_9PSEU|nr:MFS transporter [Amycolatopsis tolypomycina]SED21605.1 Major Facilitator Superfamily protein [Amycolatopsis tolypomycina]
MTAGTAVRPATGRRLVVVSGAWGAFWGTWSALLPAVAETDSATPAMLGVVLTAVPLGAIPAMALIGRLAVGREYRALFCSVAAMAVAVLALGSVTGLTALAGTLFAVGATSGAVDVCLNAATARHERETSAPHFQIVHAAFPVAVIAAAPITGLARQLGAGTHVVLVVCAVLLFLVGLPLLRTGRRPVTAGDGRPAAGGARRRTLWLLGAGLGALGGCVLVVENAVEQWSVLVLEDLRGAAPALASTAPAVYMAAMTASRVAVRKMPGLRLRRLIVIAAIGGAAGIVAGSLSPSVPVSLAGFAIAGLAFGPVVPVLLSHAGTRDSTGYLVSIASAVSYTAFLVSPVFVGTLTRWVSLPVAMASLAVMAVPLLVGAFAHGDRAEDRAPAERPESMPR